MHGETLRLEEKSSNREFHDCEYSPQIKDFSNREFSRRWLDGETVYVGADYTSNLTAQELFARILFKVNAAKKAGAKEVNLILAYPFYGRQDMDPDEALAALQGGKDMTPKQAKKAIDTMGSSFSLDVLIRHLLFEGVKKIVTMDIHNIDAAHKIIRDYDGTLDPEKVLFNIDSTPIFANYTLNKLAKEITVEPDGSNVVFFAPDENAYEAIDTMRILLGFTKASTIYFKKIRETPNDPEKLVTVIEKVSENYNGLGNKILLTKDDMADTLGTLEKMFKAALDYGKKGFSEAEIEQGIWKPKYLIAFLSHLVLSTSEAYGRITSNKLNIIGTNTRANIIKHTEEAMKQVRALDVSKLFYEVIRRCVEPGIPSCQEFKFTRDNIYLADDYKTFREDTSKKLVPFT